MTTGEYLLGRFGPLMSIVDVATLLGRSPDGVRVALYTDTDFSRKLKPAMLRVSRRVYFRTLQVTEALNLEQPADDEITPAEASTRGPRALVDKEPSTTRYGAQIACPAARSKTAMRCSTS